VVAVLKLAEMLWLAVTLLNVYEVTAPFDTPSTVTLLIAYPDAGVMVNPLLVPEATLTLPDGEIDPPAPALAVMVYACDDPACVVVKTLLAMVMAADLSEEPVFAATE